LGKLLPDPLRQAVRSLMRRIRDVRVRSAPSAPHAWRTVERGPLHGLEFLLPAAGLSPLADRIISGSYEAELFENLASQARHGGRLYDICHTGAG
jgi:hypothetical protein